MKQILEKIKRIGPAKLFRWILGVGACFLALYTVLSYIIGPSQGYFHSDCTDSLYWAQATYESGRIFSTDYKYAALLPFGASIWYVPLIALFGVTMFTQIAGMVIFTLLFTAAIVFLCRSMHWSYPASLAAAAAELLLISGSDKLREIMWGHTIYYSLGLLLLFVGLGMAIRLTEKMLEILRCKKTFRMLDAFLTGNSADDATPPPVLSRKKYISFFILLAVFTVFLIFSATDGVQVLMLCTLPMVAALFCERFFDGKTKLFALKNIPTFLLVVLSGLATLVGLSLLSALKGDITAEYAGMYSSFSAPSSWVSNLFALPAGYLSLIGVSVSKGESLVAMNAIGILVKIAVGVLIFILPFIGFFFYKKFHYSETRLILWVHLFVTAFIMVGWVVGSLSDAAWRLTPMVGTAILATVALARDFFAQKDAVLRFSVLTLAALLCFGALNMKEMRDMPADYGATNDLHLLAEKLESENLTYGYATFWYSQAITVLSDSKVKTRSISVKDSEFVRSTYQSSYSWYKDQPGQEEYFVLLTDAEYQHAENFLKGSLSSSWVFSTHIVREIEFNGYHILVFDCNIFL